MPRPPQPHKPPREDTEKIAGFPAVAALFAHDPALVLRLFFDERYKAQAAPFCKVLAAARKPYRQVATEELTKIAGSPLHGGIIAVVRPRAVPLFDPQAAKGWAAAGQPLLILDGVGNPHNLGAIARTMAFFGLKYLVLSDHSGQAMPSEAAWRVAEGGLEWLDVSRAKDLPRVLKLLSAHYRVIGTALGDHRPVDEVLSKKTKPIALVLGNEEEGLPAATQAACGELLTIPGSGRVQSLNVAATAAILISRLALI
ncbi:MAG: RNA methyltransferase [Alphaproteobacteria bacterium]|nr:RNA methyltransferase [Alphaproteobacteria bacterium]